MAALWKNGIRRLSSIMRLLLGVGILSLVLEVVYTNHSVVAPNRNSRIIVFDNRNIISVAGNNHPKTENRTNGVLVSPTPTPGIIELSSNTNATIKATNDIRNGTLNIFIHVGPHKAGSTFLQNLMAEEHAKLEEDNYFYIGKLNHRNFQETELPMPMDDLVRPFREGQDPEGNWKYSVKGNMAKKEFLKQIQAKHISQQHHLILSDEDFCKNPVKGARKLHDTFVTGLNERNSNSDHSIVIQVHIVMVYRPFFDWRVSSYRFSNLPSWYNPKTEWDNADPPGMACFRDFALKERHTRMDLRTLRDAFAEYFPVQLIHLQEHAPYPDFGSSFLCRMLGNTTQVCQHLVQRAQHGITETRANVDRSTQDAYLLDYEAMALYIKKIYYFAAADNSTSSLEHRHREGLPDEIKRRDLVIAVGTVFRRWAKGRIPTVISWEIRRQWFLPSTPCSTAGPTRFVASSGSNNASTFWDLLDLTNTNNATQLEAGIIPLLCPTETEMDYLENRTRELETLFFPVSDARPSYLRKFQEAQSEHKFCNVDLDLMFQDRLWKSYLQCLVEKNSLKECSEQWGSKDEDLNVGFDS
jgi:hypothetical protein